MCRLYNMGCLNHHHIYFFFLLFFFNPVADRIFFFVLFIFCSSHFGPNITHSLLSTINSACDTAEDLIIEWKYFSAPDLRRVARALHSSHVRINQKKKRDVCHHPTVTVCAHFPLQHHCECKARETYQRRDWSCAIALCCRANTERVDRKSWSDFNGRFPKKTVKLTDCYTVCVQLTVIH